MNEEPNAIAGGVVGQSSTVVDRRPCPSCGSLNPSPREICQRCGVDLATGEELPWPPVNPEPVVTRIVVDDRPPRWRWWFALAAVLGVASAMILALMIAEVGPFEQPLSVPEARFEPSLYLEDPEGLVLTEVATVTTAPEHEARVFEAAHMVDDDPETAWRSEPTSEDPETGQPLEIVDLYLDRPSWISALVLRNGDQLDSSSYEAASRMRRVRATADGGVTYLLNLLDDGRGRQAVTFSEPVLSTVLRLEVLDVFAGADTTSIAISDLELRGWTATEQDAQVARDRASIGPAVGQPS